jgi:MFS family permease
MPTLRRQWWPLLVLGGSQVLLVLDSSTAGITLGPIAQSLDAPVSAVRAVFTLSALLIGATLLTAGKLADVLGRRRALLLGLSVRVVGSALSAGLGAWLFGAAGSVHVGASGVIYGFLGFVMGRGIFERRFVSVLLAGITTFLYGGLMMGVFPLLAGAGVSWQGHLFGWLGGFGMARLLLSRRRPTKG